MAGSNGRAAYRGFRSEIELGAAPVGEDRFWGASAGHSGILEEQQGDSSRCARGGALFPSRSEA